MTGLSGPPIGHAGRKQGNTRARSSLIRNFLNLKVIKRRSNTIDKQSVGNGKGKQAKGRKKSDPRVSRNCHWGEKARMRVITHTHEEVEEGKRRIGSWNERTNYRISAKGSAEMVIGAQHSHSLTASTTERPPSTRCCRSHGRGSVRIVLACYVGTGWPARLLG